MWGISSYIHRVVPELINVRYFIILRLKLAAFCYGSPISASLAVCLDGPFLNVYIFQAFSVKRIARDRTRDRTRVARSIDHRANHCSMAKSYVSGSEVVDLSKILIFKNGPSRRLRDFRAKCSVLVHIGMRTILVHELINVRYFIFAYYEHTFIILQMLAL